MKITDSRAHSRFLIPLLSGLLLVLPGAATGHAQDQPAQALDRQQMQKRLEQLEKEVKRLHSYEVPEFIALPIVAGSKSYLDWLDDNT